MGLRERLAEACLASERFIAEDGYPSFGINSNAEAAEKALLVAAAWLRDEAAGYQERAEKAESSTLMTMLTIRADTLSKAADSITGSTDGH